MRRTLISGAFLLAALFFCGTGYASTPKKAIAPQIAPLYPPSTATIESELEPLIPMQAELRRPELSKGLFRLGINTDLGGGITFGGKGNMLYASSKFTLSDPFSLGAKIGLADDALEYKYGVGFAYGADNGGQTFFSVPFLADAVLYLKENSLFGLDPYIGGGINFNLIGTDTTLSGIGYRYYGGILVDLGFEAGKAGLCIGYQSLRVGSIRLIDGITLAISQPIVL